MSRTPSSLSYPERKAIQRVAFFLVVLGAGGFFFGNANPWWQVPPLVLLMPACLAIFASLLPSYWSTFYAGWACSGLAYAASLYWVSIPIHDFGDVSWLFAVPSAAALGAYLGLFGGTFSLGLRLFRQELSPVAACLLAAPFWAGLEVARGWLLTGFPWIPLASAFVPWPIWIQAAAVLGAFGLSGVFAGIGVLLAEAAPIRVHFVIFQSISRRYRFLALGGVLIPLLVMYIYGIQTLQSPLQTSGSIQVGLVQGNVNQNQKWNPRYQKQTVERYFSLSEKAVDPSLGLVQDPVDLLLWPETSMPFYIEDNPSLREMITGFSRRYNVPIAFGSPGRSQTSGTTLYHNRLWLHDPANSLMPHYDKGHLLPFGEYVPFSIPLPFIEYFQQGNDFSPGQGSVLRMGKAVFGPLICYEAIFPELAQSRVQEGANILLTVSNDAWFGRSSAPMQHLQTLILRAVEQKRSIIRSTNTGISAIIDPRGRITARGDIFRAEILVGEAVLVQTTTLFHSLKPYISWFSCLIPAIALSFCLWQQRKKTTKATGNCP